MKRIYFFEIGTIKSDWHLFVSMPLILFNAFTAYEYSYLLGALGYMILGYYFARPFLFRNYLGWNRAGMQLKINQFLFVMIRFKLITHILLSEDQLKIYTKSKKYFYDIKNIESVDLQRLLQIIETNAVGSKISRI